MAKLSKWTMDKSLARMVQKYLDSGHTPMEAQAIVTEILRLHTVNRHSARQETAVEAPPMRQNREA